MGHTVVYVSFLPQQHIPDVNLVVYDKQRHLFPLPDFLNTNV